MMYKIWNRISAGIVKGLNLYLEFYFPYEIEF